MPQPPASSSNQPPQPEASALEAPELLQQTQSLVSLLRLGQAFAAERDLDKLLETVRDETEQALNAERCTVFLYDAEKNELWSRVASGLGPKARPGSSEGASSQPIGGSGPSKPVLEEIRFPAHLGLAGYVVKTGEVLNITDAYADPRFNQEVDRKTGFHTRNLLCLPIRNRQHNMLGVFQVLNRRERAFNAEDEALLQAIAVQAGLSIENAMLSRQQKQAFESFMITLSSTIDARDPITAGHSERVADFSTLLGEQMSLASSEREALRYAALLHDIGKIGIREDVLVKDGCLTVDEYHHIQQHAKHTWHILKTIHFEPHLKQVPEIAACHHEKVDGTGYFRGLQGDEIPLLGRALALSDVFDAITSRRHYRNRMPFERVLGVLRRDSGTHFDPHVVERFFDIPLYYLAEVFVKERLYDQVPDARVRLKELDQQLNLLAFETLLQKPLAKLSPAEAKQIEAFKALYNVLPPKARDAL
jgi:HD-GYP domain-containing protein (c-di-GMP phosphodiesterase class II)